MVYVNIEYLNKDGAWRSYATQAFISGELLARAVDTLVDAWWGMEWRIRIRH